MHGAVLSPTAGQTVPRETTSPVGEAVPLFCTALDEDLACTALDEDLACTALDEDLACTALDEDLVLVRFD